MIVITFIITSVKASKTFCTGFAFSPAILIAQPNIIENTTIAMMLSFDSNFEKSFTVKTLTVLCKRDNSSVSAVSPPSSARIFAPSVFETSSKGKVKTRPIKTATTDVIMNTSTVVPSILPTLLGWLIFEIEVEMVKKISGTITINIKFMNKSPSGLNTLAPSPQITPTIAPIIIDPTRMSVCL